jgi:hypothetical protein
VANFICWICDSNKPYLEYSETKLLDEEGNKPCFECFLEAEEAEEEAEQ